MIGKISHLCFIFELHVELADAMRRVLEKLFCSLAWQLRNVLLDFTGDFDFQIKVIFNLLNRVAGIVWVRTLHPVSFSNLFELII